MRAMDIIIHCFYAQKTNKALSVTHSDVSPNRGVGPTNECHPFFFFVIIIILILFRFNKISYKNMRFSRENVYVP